MNSLSRRSRWIGTAALVLMTMISTICAGAQDSVPVPNRPSSDESRVPPALSGVEGSADTPNFESKTPNTVLTLDELERIVLQHNPTLAEAQASVRASAGRRLQSGLYPNPIVGYEGREITGGAVYRGGEHGFFVDQPIVTAGKLGLSRKVFANEEAQSKSIAELQQTRVINAVRLAYYQALAAQETVELRSNLADIAREAGDVSEKLANVGQADEPDVLEANVEAGRAALDLLAARSVHDRAWQELAAVVGDPALAIRRLAGKLDDGLPQIDRAQALDAILAKSPEVQTASLEVLRAEAAVKRARAEKFPDVDVRAGVQYNRELLGVMGQPVGWEGEATVGVQIPIFNRNQGGVQTAEAELARSQQELERVKLALRAEFSGVFQNYVTADETVRRYRDQILPDAQKAYQLYLGKYEEMAAAYPQVLIAQRTLFQLREEYTQALFREWRSAIAIQGYMLQGGLAAPMAPGEPGSVSPWAGTRPIGSP